MMNLQQIHWREDGFTLGPFHFLQEFGTNISEADAVYPTFIIMKNREIIECYIDILQRGTRYDDILELGIMKGGSSVFFNTLLAPNHHMAIDLYEHKSGLSQFGEYVSLINRKFQARFDINQVEITKVIQAYQEAFSVEARFDFIVDDASHNYELSLTSFNGLFPLLRAGGVYAIEDWGWAHWPGRFQQSGHPEYSNPALSNLILHSVLATTGGGGIISEVIVRPNITFVVRGDAPIPKGFAIENTFAIRGRKIHLY
jgi:hypothetical protein